MKVEVKLVPARTEPVIVVEAPALTDEVEALALKSLLHYGVMMLTVGLWAFLDFCHPNHMGVFFRADLWDLLLPVSIIYAVVWGVRWLVWYFELGAIRRRLGL